MTYFTVSDIQESKDAKFLKKLIDNMKDDEVYATLVSTRGGRSIKFKKSRLKEQFPEGEGKMYLLQRQSPVLAKVYTKKNLKELLKSLQREK